MNKKFPIIFFTLLFLLISLRAFLSENIYTKTLYDFDEARYAEIAKNHLKTTVWLVPQAGGPDDSQTLFHSTLNNGVTLSPYFWKPPLHPWIIAIFFKLFGQSEFITRLPSLLFSFASLIFIYLISNKLFPKNRGVGLLSALLLACTNDFSFISSQGIAESQLLFLSLASIYFLINKKPKIFLSALFISLAFMTKSFGTFWLYPLCLYLIFKNSTNKTSNILKWLTIQAILILPWHLYMYFLFKEEFITNYLLVNTIGRGTGQQQNIAPIYWYIKYALFNWKSYFIAGIIIFIPLLKNLKKHSFLIFWMLIIFIPYSIIRSKVWWYIYPFWIPFLILFSSQCLYFFSRYKKITILALSLIIILTNINTFKRTTERTDWNRGIKNIAQRNQNLSNFSVYQIPYETPLYYFNTGRISREIIQETQYILTSKDYKNELIKTNQWQIIDQDQNSYLFGKK